MYLAYLDDSDTRAKSQKWQVMGAVLIPDGNLFSMELVSSSIMEALAGPENLKRFPEFHACELYGGYGAFETVSQRERFTAIESLLEAIDSLGAYVAYGAVDLEYLKKTPCASASPLDTAFRLCADGIGDWLGRGALEALKGPLEDLNKFSALLIAYKSDSKNENLLQQSFRSMRGRLRFSEPQLSPVNYLHDDMYFGDSRYSIGIQIADLCSYFIARYLSGDAETERFYKMIEPRIVSARRQPSEK